MSSTQLSKLHSMRFIAALGVIFHHTFYLSKLENKTPIFLQNLIPNGAIAVNFFFILSGFILVYCYRDRLKFSDGSIWSFWIARISRLYPVYLLSLAISLPYVIPTYSHYYGHDRGMPELFQAAILNLPLLQAWSPKHALSWNMPGWSLSCEAFFYLIFPCLVPQIWKVKRSLLWLLLVFVFSFSLLINAALVWGSDATNHGQLWESFALYNPVINLPIFVYGIILGRLFVEPIKTKTQFELLCWNLMSNFGFLLGAFVVFLVFQYYSLFPKVILRNGLLTPFFGIMILSVASGNARFSQFLLNRSLIRLGKASFTLYLLHLPMANYFLTFSISQSPWTYLCYLSVTALISLSIYSWFEEPCRIKIRLWFKGRFEKSSIGGV